MELNGKKVLVLGLGESGRAAAKFLMHHKALVFGFDQNEELLKTHEDILRLKKNGLIVSHDRFFFEKDRYDLCVISPGFALDFQLGTIETIGEIELGCRFLKNRAIGITGTNGKTTVTMLVEHVLNKTGLKAKAVGNIGKPLTAYLLEENDPEEILVIELSSYQLETLSSKVFDAGVILNITPDHLDRYKSMEEYAKAKIKLKDCVKDESSFYVNETCHEEFKELFKEKKCCIYNESNDLNYNILYKPNHDSLNRMAAFALVKGFQVTKEQFLESCSSFKKPSHRIEFVREVNKVAFYDDSKGTNIDAVTQAVTTLQEPIYLIAGGVDKGSSYAPWKKVFKDKVKGVSVIGQAAEKIKEELEPEIDVEIFKTLEEAVRNAAAKANAGDAVLLSPGCSSFDMFRDYKERGDEFKRVVNSLIVV